MEWEYLYYDYSFDIKIISKEDFEKNYDCPFCHGENGASKEGGDWQGYWWGDRWYDEAHRETFEHTGKVYRCEDCGKYFVVED